MIIIESSRDFFRIHRWIWKTVGLLPPKKYRSLYWAWIFVYNFAVTLFYPLHLMIGLYQVRTNKDSVFKNLAIFFPDLVTTIKHVIVWYNLKNIFLFEDILATLDGRSQTDEEKIHFNRIVRTCKSVLYTIGVIYIGACLSSELSTFFGNERRLLYPGWLPIDWRKSNTNFLIANMYQFIGVSLQILTNYANDTYPPVCIAVLGGHIRYLAIRLSKLGTDPKKSQKDNTLELKMCIRDHQLLIKSYYVLGKVLSKAMFFQMVCMGFNICCTIIYLYFFANSLFATIYYIIFFVAVLLQIFPSCYLGSIFEMEFNSLPYAMFSSNWMDQDQEFKQNILILSQRGFQPVPLLCMGLFRIHLDSFYVAIKSAYTLFAVVLRVK